MFEYATRAIVLEKTPINDFDGLITLYTEELGRVSAKAKSLRKITSKLSAHLEPGTLGAVRLVGRNPFYLKSGFWVVDSLAEKKLFSDYIFLGLVKELTVDFQADVDLWNFLLQGEPRRDELVRLSGFGGKADECALCGVRNTSFFCGQEQMFVCEFCSIKFSTPAIIHI